MDERCAICNCILEIGKDEYGKHTLKGRRHASGHHYVAKRFFSSKDKKSGKKYKPIFTDSDFPWKIKPKETGTFCFECHEELLHNPVFLPEDIKRFSKLVNSKHYDEPDKTESREKLAKRIELLHDVFDKGIQALLDSKEKKHQSLHKIPS